MIGLLNFISYAAAALVTMLIWRMSTGGAVFAFVAVCLLILLFHIGYRLIVGRWLAATVFSASATPPNLTRQARHYVRKSLRRL